MKNPIIYLFVTFCLLSTQSCKQNLQDSTETKAALYGAKTTWDGTSCSGSPTDCLPEIIIYGLTEFEKVNASFTNGKNVSEYFKGEQWKLHFGKVVNENLLKVLQSNEYSMYHIEDGKKNHYFLGKGEQPNEKFVKEHLVIFHVISESK